MVFILSYDGFGAEIFIPKTAALDSDLHAMFAECVTPASTDESAP